MISAEVVPIAGEATNAARQLQQLGFRVFSVEDTVSVQGSPSLWTAVFNVRFEERSRPALSGALNHSESIQTALKSTVVIPRELKNLVKEIEFIEPPEFF